MVYAKEVDFSPAPNLFGLFANRRAALQALQTMADERSYGLLGLGSLSRGRACFRSALKRCARTCWGEGGHEGTCATLAPVSGAFAGGVLALARGGGAVKKQHPEMTQYHLLRKLAMAE